MGISYNRFAFLKVQKHMQYLQKYIKGIPWCLSRFLPESDKWSWKDRVVDHDF